MKCRWNRTMLNLCGIVAAILKKATGRNLSISGINSGHHYLRTYQILMISDNVEFWPPILYAVFWQPIRKWQTSWKFWKRRIAPQMVTYHGVNIYVSINMKQARPWMLAHLKIIWQFHAHPVHQKVSRFFGPRYIGDDFFLGPNLVSFNRTVVPYEISKVNFRVETQILVSMSEEI
jgi:hypothetical protein